MKNIWFGLTIGLFLGLLISVLLTTSAVFCFMYHRKRSHQFMNNIVLNESDSDSTSTVSDSVMKSSRNGIFGLLNRPKKTTNVISTSNIFEFTYRDLQKASYNFTNLLGHGAFGPVYKAQMLTGDLVAVKILATDSTQGEKEFKSEVMLLGRLHHRNLVNLVGYCVEKGHQMLVYPYMSKGSLYAHLYNEEHETLSWELRLRIALDVARGLEYLHTGAVPSVIHRDIKSANILLDQFMRAKVADFGLSKEEIVKIEVAKIKGTLGYLDPDYILTRKYTKKCDVYSFGVLLFELIVGRNPQQGLMEYVALASMNTEELHRWEEIVDIRLNGEFDVQELQKVANFAFDCIDSVPRKRPNMRDALQVLSCVMKLRQCKRNLQRNPRKQKETDMGETSMFSF